MSDETPINAEDPAAGLPTGPGGIFPHGSLFAFDNEELDRILFEVAGAVSGVFLRANPQQVMPTAEVEQAVRDWVHAESGGDCWRKAERLADSGGNAGAEDVTPVEFWVAIVCLVSIGLSIASIVVAVSH